MRRLQSMGPERKPHTDPTQSDVQLGTQIGITFPPLTAARAKTIYRTPIFTPTPNPKPAVQGPLVRNRQHLSTSMRMEPELMSFFTAKPERKPPPHLPPIETLEEERATNRTPIDLPP